MDENWVLRLRNELSKPLPGIEAQIRLSPHGRSNIDKDTAGKDSAVLIVLYEYNRNKHTLFIKRADYNGVHSGQVSLPGGMFKQHDKILSNTALRETKEETGIPENKIQIVGSLTSLYIPVSGITVYPYVGFCLEKPELNPDPFEVKYMIEANVEELLDPCNQKYKIMQVGDSEIEIPYFDIQGEHIWGATAMIMSEFLEIIKKM
jgi:8-oxo-dGTP pyrophosphatase MutT (NUDIX family)